MWMNIVVPFGSISGLFLVGIWCYAATLAVKDRLEAGRATAGFYIVAALLPYGIAFSIIVYALGRMGIIR